MFAQIHYFWKCVWQIQGLNLGKHNFLFFYNTSGRVEKIKEIKEWNTHIQKKKSKKSKNEEAVDVREDGAYGGSQQDAEHRRSHLGSGGFHRQQDSKHDLRWVHDASHLHQHACWEDRPRFSNHQG